MVATHPLIVDIDEVACRVGLEPVPVQGLSLAQAVRDAIESAPRKHTVGTRFRSIPCTPASARSMLDYFNHAASHFQLHGEYEKSTACAQAGESIRRALQLANPE
jgi:hypothetical protein